MMLCSTGLCISLLCALYASVITTFSPDPRFPPSPPNLLLFLCLISQESFSHKPFLASFIDFALFVSYAIFR
ncbi:hypothetical protein OIU74_023827 [Salix koriyanagi]|uniref:Secreted peptide n=1 Tax=Salix koriyanagi TaxID=2511006 RepID=A0A9Q0WG64_9ROSI|nr:hypothetical protein OIU74_023827 [Salix koriyanagi]KAJ6765025.1 hypothetical protein OIU74_023827 [Salix koriyanagi]KAJ6765026.1 hypothetical protein OIU74_023827 [Salix koriyanagi]